MSVKYAKNLIGDWEKDQFEPQRVVLQNIYETNWNKLTNDFNNLKDTLERNQKLAQLKYGGDISNIQGESYDRVRNYYQDLANRGLSSSGMVSQLERANTEATGQEVDKALSLLLKQSSEGVSALSEATGKLADSQSELNRDLANDLGSIGEAEAANLRAYADLVSSISESDEQIKATARRNSSGSDIEEEDYEFYRRLGIMDTLNSEDYTDDEKRYILASEYDVPIEQVNSLLSGINYSKTNTKLNQAIGNHNKFSKYNKIGFKTIPDIILNSALDKIYENRINKLETDLSKYTYADIMDILNNLGKQ